MPKRLVASPSLAGAAYAVILHLARPQSATRRKMTAMMISRSRRVMAALLHLPRDGRAFAAHSASPHKAAAAGAYKKALDL